jgi:hypothetical protein
MALKKGQHVIEKIPLEEAQNIGLLGPDGKLTEAAKNNGWYHARNAYKDYREEVWLAGY